MDSASVAIRGAINEYADRVRADLVTLNRHYGQAYPWENYMDYMVQRYSRIFRAIVQRYYRNVVFREFLDGLVLNIFKK